VGNVDNIGIAHSLDLDRFGDNHDLFSRIKMLPDFNYRHFFVYSGDRMVRQTSR